MFRPFKDDPFFGFSDELPPLPPSVLKHRDDNYTTHAHPDRAPSEVRSGQRRSRELNLGRQSRSHDFDEPEEAMLSFDPFESLGQMMQQMESMMLSNGNLQTNKPESASYSRSSFMTFSNDNNGKPQVYQATTATRQMPGGLRETRKAIRDSGRSMEKMAIGRYINERGNEITRQRNVRTGDIDENTDFINMDEDDIEQFEDEWRGKVRSFSRARNRAVEDQRPARQRPLDDYSRIGQGRREALESTSRKSQFR